MRRSPFARTLSAAACLLSALVPASAQEPVVPEGAYGESVAVDLMTVEVQAVDANGNVVRDLGRGDFRLFDNGRLVDLTHFEQPRGAASGSAAGAGDAAVVEGAPAAEPPGHVVVVVDNLHMGVVNRSALFTELYRALDAALRPADRVMVVDYDGAVRVALPFTDSRRELIASLEQQRDGEARYLNAALERNRGLEHLQRVAEVERRGGAGCMSIGPMAWDIAHQRHSEVLQTIGALRQLVGTLAGVPGRKTLIHVSDGVPMTPGAVEVQYAIDMCDGTAVREGDPNARDVTTSEGLQNVYWDPESSRLDLASLDTSNDWYLLAAQATAHRVAFYPLQSSGLTGFAQSIGGQVRTTAHVETLIRRDPQDTLMLLASETGGRAVTNTNDLGSTLAGALRAARDSYVLGFTPAPGSENRRHALRVEISRPGVELTYPRSYYRKSAHGQMVDAVSSSLLHGVEANSMGVQIGLAQAGEGAGGGRLRVTLPLERATLLPAGDGSQGLLTLFVAFRPHEGATSEVRQKTIPLRVPVGGSVAQPFVHEIGLGLGPGRHQIAVGVYDEISGTHSYLRREVVIDGQAPPPQPRG